MRVLLAAALIIVALVFIGIVASSDDERSGSPSVYARIDSLTDCRELQREFDIADRNGNVDYMTAANDRMREVGCFG